MDPKKERDWADQINDPENTPDYEPAYRGGDPQYECWAENGYTQKAKEQPVDDCD